MMWSKGKPKTYLWYRLLWWFFLPIVVIRTLIKALRQKDYQNRFFERLGRVPSGEYDLMIHAVSVGEAKMALWLRSQLPAGLKVLFSTTTPTGAGVIMKGKPQDDRHVFWPWDHAWVVGHWLRHIKFRHLLLLESELWPEMCCQLSAQGVNIWLVNARLSSRSMKRHQKFPWLLNMIKLSISGVYPESEQSAKRFKALNMPLATDCFSSIKFGQARPSINDQLVHQIIKQKKKPMVVVASTHEGEEQLIIQALQGQLDDIHLVVVPRHPHRVAGLLNQCSKAALFQPGVNMDASIWMVSSMGQLGTWFEVADVIIMGGSYQQIGGHNPLEALWRGVPVIVGPYVAHFMDMYTDLARRQWVWPVGLTQLGFWLRCCLDHRDKIAINQGCFHDYMGNHQKKLSYLLRDIEKSLTKC